MSDDDPALGRTPRVLPVADDVVPALPSTETQRKMAAVVSRSVRPKVQRARGCGFRALFLDTPLVEFCERATIALALRMGLARSGGVLLDLGFDDGAVWENLFARLGEQGCRAPIYLIAVRDHFGLEEERVHREAHLRLTKAADAHGLNLRLVFANMSPLDCPGPLDAPEDLPLLINACFALHHIPDDGVQDFSSRTRILRRLRLLNPRLFVCAEPDFGPFAERRAPRFGVAPDPASPIAEAIETLRREHTARHGGPSPYTDPDDVRTPPPLLLEGESPPTERPEIPDRAENWRRRFQRAGFAPVLLAPIRAALVSDLYLPPSAVVAPDREAMRLTWEGKPLVSVSAWRPAD